MTSFVENYRIHDNACDRAGRVQPARSLRGGMLGPSVRWGGTCVRIYVNINIYNIGEN